MSVLCCSFGECETVAGCCFAVLTAARDRPVLMRMQSLFIKLEDGTPVAWAFIGMTMQITSLDYLLLTCAGFDGSLVSLHCEVGTNAHLIS